jgi:hypothetical protein
LKISKLSPLYARAASEKGRRESDWNAGTPERKGLQRLKKILLL